MQAYAFDTNILIYIAGLGQSLADAAKTEVADALLKEALKEAIVVLPVQVCLELHNALIKKGGFSRQEASRQVREFADGAELIASDAEVLAAAIELSAQHRLQTYDAVILAAAARAGCDILFSEDMQDGFEWSGVRIVNPFA